ncbi:protein transport protein sec24 [Andrographis paniculata]|uniref:protein transport protein sec24 n=1 Tax=Andrographis paniculata TaxID=175694 RepID=UPI0021E74D10|nr:protein transport protein sec24 [Andrographis paniculata]XP_051142509.1 protein transport protein sec24 [Andrographis paniculata]XP_051142510.1 protein transport protein sec24 [Andrographis paniculata]
MAVRPTMARFPGDPAEQEACGVPWGLTLTPFAGRDENDIPPCYGSGGELLPRCENCWAYYNTYCEQDQWSWDCSLCGTTNGLTSASIARYSGPQTYPENASSFIDLELPLEGDGEMEARPVYVAAVDLSSSEEFLELTKIALLAALEALGPGSLFGLATFSHKIGLYDVQGPIPVVKNVFIPPDSLGNLAMGLEDVMPLFSFLAPVDTCKDRITAALETLRPTTSWERTTAAGQSDGVLLGGRGFGVAMEALLKYLGSEYGNTYALARVFAFLSGPPDYGLGQLDTRRYGEQYASKGEDADRALLPEQTPFYKDLAAVAVQAGVCVDIFAVTNEYTDLASLKFLSIESGGSLFLYSSTDDSTLPQDMYRMLNRPYAFNCILRVRTSSEFKLSHSYGHFFPDPEYENVQHIICCDSFATYAYDFDFVNGVGFSRHSKELPTIQVAFQYTIVVPPDETTKLGSSPSIRAKYSLQRRLRIRTVQFGTARNINEIYDGVDPEVVLSILVHEVILSSLENGVREGRLLLHEWLVNLTAQYNDAYKLAEYVRGALTTSQVDVAFTQCPQLQSLPRLVFALLRNPLLRFHEEGVHPDYRIYLQCLFSALEPSSLSRAVYPLLSSYETPDKQAFPRHSLSRAALITSGSPIFFLDAFTTLIVFYSSTANTSLPFPPPQDCLLRTTINKVKQERIITPKLIFIRGGQDDATAFENYLIEEQDVEGSGFTSIMGFVSFLEEINRDVVEYMTKASGNLRN